MDEAQKILEELRKDFGTRAYAVSEAPEVRVISTGVTSLDIATGVGGYPRGTVVEVYGRPSVGKTGLAFYSVASVHKSPNALVGWVNVERAPVDKNWAQEISGLDPERLICVDSDPGSESVTAFGKMCAMQKFDMVIFDSVGAMRTDKEMTPGEKKQAFGQSAMVTQLVGQAMKYIYDNGCIALILNQVRADDNNPFEDKAPGGYAKEHSSTIRVLLKESKKDQIKGKVQGHEIQVMQRITAQVKKNRVSAPRKRAGWNFWNYPSPDGVIGIDIFQDSLDTALRLGTIERRGAWYYHETFPSGQLQGGVAVNNFLKDNREVMEQIRRDMVMGEFSKTTPQEEEREVLADVTA